MGKTWRSNRSPEAKELEQRQYHQRVIDKSYNRAAWKKELKDEELETEAERPRDSY
jgi:hypothetical protein